MKNFVVYKSSAGSGKTYTLVYEYLKIIIKEPGSYKNILAITFTNKAAEEMKQRVLKSLKELSDAKDSGLCKSLAKDLLMTEDMIKTQSFKALRLILHNYTDFAISTIDSFVHRIIRTFSRDLYLSGNFDLEIDEDKLMNEAVDILISKVGHEEELTNILINFLETKADEGRSVKIENDIKTFAKVMLKENSQEYLKKIKHIELKDYSKIIDKITKFTKDYENEVQSIAKKAYDLIKHNNISNKSFSQGERGVGCYFEKLSGGNFENIAGNRYVKTTFEEDKWYSGSCSEIDKNAINSIKDKLQDYYELIIKKDEVLSPKYNLFNLLKFNIYPLAVLNEIKKIIDKIKEDNNILHINEFNNLINEIVLNEPVPFIYERIGNKYHHYLIDEFQDTSRMQWQNLLPLLDNSLGSGNFNLVVGDGKQAIYRFRNGDFEQFISLPNLPSDFLNNKNFKDISNSLKKNYEEKILKINYRSAKDIVDFNNELFTFLSEKKIELKDVLKDVSQEVKKTDLRGYVRINLLEEEDIKNRYCEETLEIIKSLKDDKFNLRDIAILCRDNKNASLISEYLLRNEIPVVSSESILLCKSPVVNFILSCLKFISERIYIKDDNSESKHIVVEEIRNYLDKSNNSKKDLPKLSLYKKPLYDICESIIREYKLNETEEINYSLCFFLNNVHQYTLNNNDNISDFLDWWEENKNKLSLIIPDELNAVKVMTVHKAKGLQFPVVIYPFADQCCRTTLDWLWIDVDELKLESAIIRNAKNIINAGYKNLKESEDQKSYIDFVNILYVALTRPEERLYILTSKLKTDPKELKNIQSIFKQFLMDKKLYDENKDFYEFGEKLQHKESDKDKNNASTIVINKLISSDRDDILIRTSFKANEGIEFGNKIHYVLSLINYPDDIINAIDNAILNDIISEQEKEKIETIVRKIISNQKISGFFQRKKGMKIRNERELLTKDNKIYRPDKVVVENENAFIIDYKTGSEEKSHIEQINQYGEMLEDIYKNIKKYLVYIDEDKVVEVK